MHDKQENDISIKNILKDVVGKIEANNSKENILKAWRKSVKEDMRQYSEPVNYNSGKLIIHVSDSSRLYELSSEKGKLKSKMNRELGKKEIREIRFKIGKIKTGEL